MTAATPADDAAWAALLPGGTVWLSRPPRRAEPQTPSAGFAAAPVMAPEKTSPVPVKFTRLAAVVAETVPAPVTAPLRVRVPPAV